MRKNHLAKTTLALLSVLCIVFLAACGGQSSSASASSSAAAAPAESSSSAAEPAAADAKPGKAPAAEIKKIAMLLPGVITDQAWCTTAYKGLETLKSEGYETAYTENLEVVNIEAAFRNYAQQGYDLIIGHGSQFADAGIRVAAEFPDKYFFVFGKKPSGDAPVNIGFVDGKAWEPAYLCGAVAALMSKSGTVGYIGGVESPVQLSMKNGYVEGAKAINPDINVQFVMTGSFSDPAKGKEAALAMIEEGADVVMHTADTTGLGVIEACKEKNVYAIGNGSDQNVLAPDLVLTSLMEHVDTVIVNQVQLIKDGDFGGVYAPNMASGVYEIAPLPSWVPDDVKTQVQDLQDKIISGELVVTESYD